MNFKNSIPLLPLLSCLFFHFGCNLDRVDEDDITVVTTSKFSVVLGQAGKNERGVGVVSAPGGGYVVVVNDRNCTSSNCLQVFRINKDGVEKWMKSYSYQTFDACYATAVKAVSDGYVIAGYVKSGTDPRDAFGMKIDTAGNIKWAEKFNGGSTGKTEQFYDVIQTSDGGYVFSGYYYDGTNDYKNFLVKTNATGDQTWYEVSSIRGDGYAVTQLSNNNLLVLSGHPYDSVKVLTFNPSTGNLISHKSAAGKGNLQCIHMVKTSDGGFAIVGESGFDQYTEIYLLKINGSLNKSWETIFSDQGEFEGGTKVAQSTDGGYGILGKHGLGDIALIKTDGNGTQKWEKDLGSGTGGDIIATADGGFIITGEDNSGGIIVIKTDKDGNFN